MKIFNPLNEIALQSIGKMTNAHSHLDRAYTLTREDFENSNIDKHLFEKWKIVKDIKLKSSEADYYQRIMRAAEYQFDYGVRSILTFIDIDEHAEEKALNAAVHAKKELKEIYNIDLIIANQTLSGVTNSKIKKMIEKNMDKIDILGGLPRVENFSEHIDVIFNWAKDTGKRVHVHVDQLNTVKEHETEMLLTKAKEYKLYDRVTAVHSISLAAHPKSYRKNIYKRCKEIEMSFVTCPTAWIDHRRNEELNVNHNSITPVEELLEHDITVAIGTDNIHDIYKPYSTGDLLVEAKFLIECLHFYDIKSIVNILTVNGRKILGL